MNERRRRLLRGSALAVLSSLSTGLPLLGRAAPGDSTIRDSPAKIGIIGAGQVGGTLGRLWAHAGHDVLLSSRDPAEVAALVQDIGEHARAGTPGDAAAFGDVVLLAVPYGALPSIAQALSARLKGKIILDASNPYAWRDGDTGVNALKQGAGLASAHFFPGARLVRGFNSIDMSAIVADAHRVPERVAVPIAGDDQQALQAVTRLVQDAGFDAVVTGSLASASKFQPGGPLFEQILSAKALRQRLATS